MPPAEKEKRPIGTPTVSRVFDDGTLVELLYDPDARTTAFAVRAADGTLRIEETVVAADGLLTITDCHREAETAKAHRG